MLELSLKSNKGKHHVRADAVPPILSNDDEATDLTVCVAFQVRNTEVRPVPRLPQMRRVLVVSRRLGPKHHKNTPNLPELVQSFGFYNLIT